MSTLTRDQAAQIAAEVLRFRSQAGTYDVHKVVTLEEIAWARPLPPYGVSRDIFEKSWIVYLHPKQVCGLMSSTIMVVSRETGHVTYFGSAHDEG